MCTRTAWETIETSVPGPVPFAWGETIGPWVDGLDKEVAELLPVAGRCTDVMSVSCFMSASTGALEHMIKTSAAIFITLVKKK
jgi:hypothetical protein